MSGSTIEAASKLAAYKTLLLELEPFRLGTITAVTRIGNTLHIVFTAPPGSMAADHERYLRLVIGLDQAHLGQPVYCSYEQPDGEINDLGAHLKSDISPVCQALANWGAQGAWHSLATLPLR